MAPNWRGEPDWRWEPDPCGSQPPRCITPRPAPPSPESRESNSVTSAHSNHKWPVVNQVTLCHRSLSSICAGQIRQQKRQSGRVRGYGLHKARLGQAPYFRLHKSHLRSLTFRLFGVSWQYKSQHTGVGALVAVVSHRGGWREILAADFYPGNRTGR